MENGNIYIFDKRYVNHTLYHQWTKEGLYFVTRMKDNALYQVLSEDKTIDVLEAVNCGGILRDEIITLKLDAENQTVPFRPVTYKDPLTGKILVFISNLMGYQAQTIAQLYRCRWGIEPFLKQLKQNFELGYFYSDSSSGIETQIWIAFIANLIFTLIHQPVKEAEQFITIVATARANMGSFVCIISILVRTRLNQTDRNNGIVQLQIFQLQTGGTFHSFPPNSS